jgi:hypothetical protein
MTKGGHANNEALGVWNSCAAVDFIDRCKKNCTMHIMLSNNLMARVRNVNPLFTESSKYPKAILLDIVYVDEVTGLDISTGFEVVYHMSDAVTYREVYDV